MLLKRKGLSKEAAVKKEVKARALKVKVEEVVLLKKPTLLAAHMLCQRGTQSLSRAEKAGGA
eukprot:6630688-Prorocentrum_lima.AAC.1